MRISTLAVSLATLVACIPDLGRDTSVAGGSAGGIGETGIDGPEESEFGPENDWWHANDADVPSGLEGTGFRTGDVAYDFTAVDQNGDEVQLYQFYGQVILLDVLTEWCGPCQDMAPHGEDTWQQYKDEGLVYIAVIQEDAQGARPDADTAAGWASSFDLTHPVLADEDKFNNDYIVSGYPTVVVIDREMNIATDDLWPFDPSFVEDYL